MIIPGAVASQGSGGASYHADAVHFDGSDFLNTESLTCTDSTNFSMSVWFKLTTAVPLAASQALWVSDPLNFYITYCELQAPAQVRTVLSNDDGEDTITVDTNPDNLITNDWHHLLVSVDANHAEGQKVAKVYLDDVDVTQIANDAGGAFSVALNGLKFVFAGSDGGGTAGFDGDIADFWCAPAQSLLTAGDIPEATRRKFISAAGKPVDLGADGATPTGVAPAIFFSGDATGFGTNKGTGGAFTLAGSLTNASTSPSD